MYNESVFPGASSGIGAATAKLFSRLGASVALTGRNVENLQAVGKECNQVFKHLVIFLSSLYI